MYDLKGRQLTMNDVQGRPIYIELFARYSYLKWVICKLVVNELFARLSCLHNYLHGSRVYDDLFLCSPVYSLLFANVALFTMTYLERSPVCNESFARKSCLRLIIS